MEKCLIQSVCVGDDNYLNNDMLKMTHKEVGLDMSQVSYAIAKEYVVPVGQCYHLPGIVLTEEQMKTLQPYVIPYHKTIGEIDHNDAFDEIDV